jgi:hypothetical protein
MTAAPIRTIQTSRHRSGLDAKSTGVDTIRLVVPRWAVTNRSPYSRTRPHGRRRQHRGDSTDGALGIQKLMGAVINDMTSHEPRVAIKRQRLPRYRQSTEYSEPWAPAAPTFAART